jgi:NTE family protein
MSENGTTKKVAIACQGGGVHASFAAGVLKEILNNIKEKPEYEIVALSGTSGGAICAYLTWYALMGDNKQEAIELLNKFWKEDNSVHFPEEAWVVNSSAQTMNRFLEYVSSVWPFFWTPSINPHNFPKSSSLLPLIRSPDYWQDQLRDMIASRVNDKDIEERVKSSKKEKVTPPNLGPMLYIGAANPRTGEFQVFRSHKPHKNDQPDTKDESCKALDFNRSPNDGISVEAVLASAALPSLFKAVHTGRAVYWHTPQPQYPCPRVEKGVYWDGLYSSNPPIHELAVLCPDEIWVIQINPEEIHAVPKKTENLEDRRNELSGNLSLNQELRFVRKTNELIRKYNLPKNPVKVRRIELTRPLNYFSKLDRAADCIKLLMEDDGPKEATPFLEALDALSPFEEAWDEALRGWKEAQQQDENQRKKVVDDVVDLFTDDATIKLVPPYAYGSSASEQRYMGKQEGQKCIQEAVRRCLEGNFSLEQARYYRVNGKEICWWMLSSSNSFDFPLKGLAKVELSDHKIKCFAFYPVDMKLMEELEAAEGA